MMATYVFENIDNQLYAHFKQFADSLGVGFQVIDKSKKTERINPKPPTANDDIMAYAGILRGAWGETPKAVEARIAELKAEWNS